MNRNPSMAGLASLVQSRGRNGDTMLVHMTPDEVHGLQRLALAHGGSLTLNPDTGLYEANFLKKLLPTILGFGLNFLFPGLGALGSGLLVGAGETIRTGGDLGKGLMAGLGAFGGASLGAGLSAAGSSAAKAGTQAVADAGLGATGNVPAAFVPGGAQAATQAANTAMTGIEALQPVAVTGKTVGTPSLFDLAKGAAANKGTTASTELMNLAGKNLSTMGRGIGALGSEAGRSAFMSAVPGGQMGLMAGGMGVANAMTPELELPDAFGQIDDSYYEGGDYDPATGTFKQGRWRKGYPGFPPQNPIGAAGGGLMPRTNYNYPQAGITKSNYAPSLEYTKPQEILDGYDTKINPFTGEEAFADGGTVPEQRSFSVDSGTNFVAPQMVGGVQPVDPMQSYYQGLIAPPQQQAYDPSFFQYMQAMNNYVTSPVAPPPPPKTTTPTQPTTPTTPPTTPFDPNNFDFSNIDFNNFNFSDLSNYLQNNSDNRMVYDPATGGFRTPGAATTPATTTPAQQNQYDPTKFDPSKYQYNPFVDGFDPSQLDVYEPSAMRDGVLSDNSGFNSNVGDYGFDPNVVQYKPFVDDASLDYQSTIPEFNFTGPDMTYGQAMAQGNLTDIGQFAEPSYDFAGGTQGFDMGNVPLQPANTQGGLNFAFSKSAQQPSQYDFSGLGQMGDMGAYGQQFQGFQPLPTDFGSTYQPPAMMAPSSLDMMAYSQQPTDFGSMGNYGLGALGGAYQAPQFQMPSYDFSAPAPEIPTTSYSAPMTTGMDSTGVSAPQFGFGNSDVLYGQSMLGGGEPNIFGFAGGGAIQKAAAGKLVTGDGDGMSDDIRANINGDQEARLADGEFVIPADVVSHLGNGSTDAGADRLYAMMDRIRKARTGRTRQAPEIEAEKYLPA